MSIAVLSPFPAASPPSSGAVGSITWTIAADQLLEIVEAGASVDMNNYLLNTTGLPLTFTYFAGPGLPSGVTLSASGILSAASGAAIGTSTGHQVQAST